MIYLNFKLYWMSCIFSDKSIQIPLSCFGFVCLFFCCNRHGVSVWQSYQRPIVQLQPSPSNTSLLTQLLIRSWQAPSPPAGSCSCGLVGQSHILQGITVSAWRGRLLLHSLSLSCSFSLCFKGSKCLLYLVLACPLEFFLNIFVS